MGRMRRWLLIVSNCLVATVANGQCPPPAMQTLVASEPQDNGGFGQAVATWGDTMVVGAPAEYGPGAQAGSAYIFKRQHDGQWALSQRIRASDPSTFARFGHSVAMCFDTILVGASMDSQMGQHAGAAYVFRRDGTGNWSQQTKLTAFDAAPGDDFGWSVAVSGSTMVIGSIHDDGPVGSSWGSAYLYRRTLGGAWVFHQKVVASDGHSLHYFGTSVATVGEWVFVGVPADSNVNGWRSGAVYVFQRQAGGWAERQKLTAVDGHEIQAFGTAVHADRHWLLVGAPNTIVERSMTGAAYLFSMNAGSWVPRQTLAAPDSADGDYFGGSVAIDGVTALVGALRDGTLAPTSGSVYQFQASGAGMWEQTRRITLTTPAEFDRFGYVALWRDTVVVGAPNRDDTAGDGGAAYVFRGSCAGSADVNGDGVVNVIDLLIVLAQWGACPTLPQNCPADVNGDGNVNVSDLLAIILAM